MTRRGTSRGRLLGLLALGLIATGCAGSDDGRENGADDGLRPGTEGAAAAILDDTTAFLRERGRGGYDVVMSLGGRSVTFIEVAFDLDADVARVDIDSDPTSASGSILRMRYLGDDVYTSAEAFGECWAHSEVETANSDEVTSAPPGALALLDPVPVGLTEDPDVVVAEVLVQDLLYTSAPKIANSIDLPEDLRVRVEIAHVAGEPDSLRFEFQDLLEVIEEDGVDLSGVDGLEEFGRQVGDVRLDYTWSSRVRVDEPDPSLVFELSDPSSAPPQCQTAGA